MRGAVQWSTRSASQAVHVVIVVAMLLDIRACAQESGCQYRYTEQPRPNPICDPYQAGILIIECTVEVPLDASELSIGWFLDCDQLHNNPDVTIAPQMLNATMVRILRSRLTIINFSDTYAGQYTCNLLGDEEFIPSNLLRLPTEDVLIAVQTLSACTLIQSQEVEKCAELSENMTIPMSLTCTEPVMVSISSSDIIMTSTSAVGRTTTLSQTSTLLSHPPSTFSPAPTFSPLPTSTPTLSKETTTSGVGDIWLYVVATLAVLLFVILIIVVVLYVKKSVRQSHRKTHKDLQHETDNIDMKRNALYGASPGGPTPSNGMHMRINEVYGAHIPGCSTAADPLRMRINEVYGVQRQPSVEEIQYHNADVENTPHVSDYIPLDSSENTACPPVTTDIPATDTPLGGVSNPLSSTEV